MYLKQLSLLNFKNYPSLELSFSPRINCFTGNNGVGKTNLLDSLYYLSFCKSYFSNVDALNVSHNQQLMVIQGHYNIANSDETIFCSFETPTRKKTVQRNKKEYERLAEHIGLIPLVMVAPGDIFLILGGSDERRKFMDGIIAQYNREYLFQLQRYNKTLAQRNTLLKNLATNTTFDPDIIEIYDHQLAESGTYIHQQRRLFIDEIIPVFQRNFNLIAENNETVSLTYNSTLHQLDLLSQLKSTLRTDILTRYTSVGIHKDDLELLIDAYPIKKTGSQGQQKSYLVSLKLAQFEYIKTKCGFSPILLLDDVFDKLDQNRVRNIVEIVTSPTFGQIFISDTNFNRIHEILNDFPGEYAHFEVKNAQITKVHATF